jgi:hypothetical protein
LTRPNTTGDGDGDGDGDNLFLFFFPPSDRLGVVSFAPFLALFESLRLPVLPLQSGDGCFNQLLMWASMAAQPAFSLPTFCQIPFKMFILKPF